MPTKTTLRDSRATFADLGKLAAGQRHSLRSRTGGRMSILRFGVEQDFLHVFFSEDMGGEMSAMTGSGLLLPQQLEDMATDGMPLNHLEESQFARRSTRSPNSVAEVKKVVAKEAAEKPKAAQAPSPGGPESVQSPAEARIFQQLKSKELIDTTLGRIFGDEGLKLQPGQLIDGSYMDSDKSLPTREIIYYVNPSGIPIVHAYFNFYYDTKKRPTLVITRSVDSIDSETHREVTVEQTLKSTSFSAGLVLALESPTGQVSSGPKLGDKVHSMGKEMVGPGGNGLAFNASYLKTHSNLRIEAELDIQERLGKFTTDIAVVPRS